MTKTRHFNATHGLSKTHIYRVWVGMRLRCNKPDYFSYSSYGGRGISICNKWSTFEGFYEEMGDSYVQGLVLDRIDNDGNYESKNCRWSTKLESNRNKRTVKKYLYQDKNLTIPEWAILMGIKEDTLFARLKKYKMTIKDALERPIQKH